MKFGDVFEVDGIKGKCVVVGYFSDDDWWYVEEKTSRVLHSKNVPLDKCKWIKT